MDVLPATLDGFYSLYGSGQASALTNTPEQAPLGNASAASGLRLAWDDQFPVLRDADGDGLLSAAYGGSDPNDGDWDSDDDGLSDKFEFDRRQFAGWEGATSLLSEDTDYDGLCDDQELQFGTHPNRRDSDGDGLLDSEEVYHQARCGGNPEEWMGGWDFEVNGLVTHVTSEPMNPDTDGDGLDDKAERTLGENPRAWTENPMTMSVAVDDEDRIVGPGQSLAYTMTVENGIESDIPLYCLGDLGGFG